MDEPKPTTDDMFEAEDPAPEQPSPAQDAYPNEAAPPSEDDTWADDALAQLDAERGVLAALKGVSKEHAARILKGLLEKVG